MKQKWFFLLLSVAFLIVGCQGNPTIKGVDSVSASVDTLAQAAQTMNQIAAAPTPTVQASPTPDECVECHTDKERLIDTASLEEEDSESESKGVG